LTVQVRLLPDTETIAKLEATTHAFNEAADWPRGETFALHSANKIALQKTHYTQLRKRFGLSAQIAVRCIAQICEAYKKDKDVRPHFRALASIPYDARLMSFKGSDAHSHSGHEPGIRRVRAYHEEESSFAGHVPLCTWRSLAHGDETLPISIYVSNML
jgi:hypothetical protein